MVQFLVTFCGHCAPLFFVAAVVSNRLLAGNGFIGSQGPNPRVWMFPIFLFGIWMRGFNKSTRPSSGFSSSDLFLLKTPMPESAAPITAGEIFVSMGGGVSTENHSTKFDPIRYIHTRLSGRQF